MKASHINLTVKIDPGTDIQDAFREAVNLAGKLGVVVEFQFNDVKCMAFPAGDVKSGLQEFCNASLSGKTHKFAAARTPEQQQ